MPKVKRSKSPARKSTQNGHKVGEEVAVAETESVQATPLQSIITTSVGVSKLPLASPPVTPKEDCTGPIARFLKPDEPQKAYPTLRVALMLVLGFLLSTSVVWLSEDEFIEGSKVLALNNSFVDFPVHIAFKDVGCHITGVGDVLHGVTGHLPMGQLTGILGASGSGKTSFAYQLLGRGKRHCSPAYGAVYLNGRPRALEAFLDRVGFVPQEDIFGELTVEETLMFSAAWRLPRTFSDEDRADIVNDTLSILNLQRVRHSKIGSSMRRGISGGETRRVSIGMELVAKPSVLVMDEPTTSLDGAGAYKLMKTLRDFVDNRKDYVSVVAVLHQPSERVYDLLQNVILMSRGTVVFCGRPVDALAFLKECGFTYEFGSDPFNRSSAEYILDVLSGEVEMDARHRVQFDNVDQLLQRKWQEKFARERSWERIELEMNAHKTKENEIIASLMSSPYTTTPTTTNLKLDSFELMDCYSSSLWTSLITAVGLLDHCRDPSHQSDLFCVVFIGTPFPVLPKPGLRKQVHLWFWLGFKMSFRRGVVIPFLIIHGLAIVVAFVRSFNHSWSRRPHSNFVLSIVISLIGIVGAVFNDEILPVQRAAASGMILAAHELSQIAYSLISGWVFCHWFAINYFSFIWLRNGVWCCAPFRLEKYYEFAHILHLHYLVSSGIGSCICAFTAHDMRTSFLISVGCLMHFHVFALFSPSKSQAERDTKILFGQVDISPIVMFYARWSYVRYTLEALMLWEPDTWNDKNARSFTLRYFSYEETNFTADLTWLFALWCISLSTRFVLFAFGNVNAYNTAYDIPLFVVFVLKVVLLHFTALVMMTIVHETYTTVKDYYAEYNPEDNNPQAVQETKLL